SDTLNPAGGVTAAGYQRFAARFDTLVYPADVANFAAPADVDKNKKIGLLFTTAVHELTPANSQSYLGGRFVVRDLYPSAATTASSTPAERRGTSCATWRIRREDRTSRRGKPS